MLFWMLYATAVTVMTGLAALELEAGLRIGNRPTRWVWIAAVGTAVGVMAVAWVDAGPARQSAVSVGPPRAISIGGLVPDARQAPVQERWTFDPSPLDRPLALGWLLASGALLGMFSVSALRLFASARRWPERSLQGQRVRISADVGPAAVGIVRPQIVVPRWVLEADGDARRWILAHELEHVRARDPALVTLALLTAILVPWNVALWWHLHRLRLAVEADCDQRVLRGAGPGERRRYGRLLLEVGRRAVGAPPLPAFAERPHSLEQRIRIMTRMAPTFPVRRAVLLFSAGAVLVAAACVMPGPDERASLTEPELDGAAPTLARLAEGPTFTPFTAAPTLLNAAEVMDALEREYPPMLREAGVTGEASVYFLVDAHGEVRDVRLDRSSGQEALDAAALRVAAAFRFGPAVNRDEPVAAWVRLPIAFGARETVEASRPSPSTERNVRRPGLADGPTFTPYTVAPRLTNRDEVTAAFEAAYPPELRTEGVGGKALVYFFIGADGSVRDVRINESSGLGVLDAAALDVGRTMRFTPAENAGEPVPVWISLPISFAAR